MEIDLESTSLSSLESSSVLSPREIMHLGQIDFDRFKETVLGSDTSSSKPSTESEDDNFFETFLADSKLIEMEYNVTAKDIRDLEKSTEYKLHKPKLKESMYFVLMKRGDSEEEIQQLAELWIKEYQNQDESKDAFYLIYQLVLDIMGYQKIQIANHKEQLEKSFSFLKTILETAKPTLLHRKNKFILKDNNKCCKTISAVYFKYLKEWFLACCAHGLIIDEVFSDMLIKYIGILIGSKNYIIKFNILVFVSKIITCVVLALKQLGPINAQKERKLNLLLDTMNNYFWKELIYCTYDTRMSKMRLIVMFDINNWLRLDPKYFIKNPLIKTLKLFLFDYHYMVRFGAVNLSSLLITTTESDKTFNENLSQLIAKCFMDKREEVRIKTVKYFITFVKRFPNKVPPLVKRYIQLGLAAKSYPLAQQCALYNKAALESFQLDSWANVYMLSNIKELARLRRLVVPALLSAYPELKNVKPLLEGILSVQFDEADLNICMEILYYVAKYLLTAENDFQLNNQPFDENIIENNKLFSKTFLPYVLPMLNHLENKMTSFHWLLKTAHLINYKDINDASSKIHIVEINNHLVDLLPSTKNIETLKLMGKLIAKFTEGPFNRIISTYFEKLTKWVFNNIDIIVNVDSFSDLSSEDYLHYLNDLRLISYLFEFFDFTYNINYDNIRFDWGVEEFNQVQSDMLLVKYQLTLCRWYLRWNLKNIFSVEHFETLLNDFYKKVKLFYWYCLKIFAKHNSYATQLAAFLELSGFLIDCKDYFKCNKINYRLDIQLNDSLIKEYENFVKYSCFEVRRDTRSNEERILMCYFAILTRGYINFKNIVNILEYYIEFKHDYKRIFNYMFNFMLKADPSRALTSVTLLTIITSFKKRGQADIKYVEDLSCELCHYIPKNLIEACIRMSINYVLNEPQIAPFLRLLKPFIMKLNSEQKDNCVKLTNILIERRNLSNNAAVQHFLLYLKKVKLGSKWSIKVSSEGSLDASSMHNTSSTI